MPPKTSHSEKYPTSKTLSVKCYQVLVLHIKTICRFADLRGNREAGAGGKDDAATIGKPEKNEGAVFQKTGGATAETDDARDDPEKRGKGWDGQSGTREKEMRSFKKRGGATAETDGVRDDRKNEENRCAENS